MKTPREISMGYRILASRPNQSRADVLREMIAAVDCGMLAPGLEITWSVRGKETDFGELIFSANEGLKKLVKRRLLRDLEGRDDDDPGKGRGIHRTYRFVDGFFVEDEL